MTYPIQCQNIYTNNSGNVFASGYYRSWMNQDLANMFPPWMHLRQNPNSVGQQFLSPASIHLEALENSMNSSFKSKYITTAPISEIDILYRTRIPNNINTLDPDAGDIKCVAAPSGFSPSGVYKIELEEKSDLEEFYYYLLPTRAEVVSSGSFVSSVDGTSWNVRPSGVWDRIQYKVDVWYKKHDLTWCYDSGYMLKQDRETLETYEAYALNGSGTLIDMAYDNGMLWWIGRSASGYYLNLTSTRTQMPNSASLDLLSVMDITDAFRYSEPSGIIVDLERQLWICDTNRSSVFEVHPCYDYFTVDKTNGYIYFREDYSDSGVFISNV